MKKILLFIFFATTIFSDEINISLKTKNILTPVYLSYENDFDKNPLYDVLEFDLKNSGYCEIVSDKKLAQFVISPTILKNKILFEIFEKNKNKKFKLCSFDISEKLTIDRKKIHKVSDHFLKTCLNKKGIATTKILFTKRYEYIKDEKKQYYSDIWVSDYDGQNAKKLISDGHYNIHPIFIPGSNNFIFSSYRTNQSKIYISSINGSEKTPLIRLSGNQLLPSISNDGNHLAFISDISGRADLFLLIYDDEGNLIKKPIQLFSKPRTTNASSTFSPNADKIAFVSDKDGPPRIYIMNINDRIKLNKRPKTYLITKRNRHNVTPTWSNNGNLLAYSAKTNNFWQIWIYDFEKDEEKQVTFDQKNKENPIFAQDNLHLVYNTEDKNSQDVYIVDINQKKPIKISEGRFPFWEKK